MPRRTTTRIDVVGRRLRGTLLVGSRHTTGAGVVRELGAVQAQDYRGAKWALGMRARGTTNTSIEREHDAGDILRTHVLRPTWHFVAPSDIRWMMALTGARISRVMGYYSKVLGLTPKVFARSHDTIARALEGGKHLTRLELREELRRVKVPTDGGQRLGRLMMEAELDGIVCSGPVRGKQFTYGLLDERVRPADPRERDDALSELARRYFTTRGPATPQDFAWWSGLTVGDANRAIEILGKSLEPVEVEGRKYWVAAGSRDVKPVASAHLLPNYDEFFIGYKDRSAIGKRLKSVKAVTGGSALIAHVIAVNGQLVGGWKRVITRDGVSANLQLLTKLTGAESKLVDAAVEKLKTFFGSR